MDKKTIILSCGPQMLGKNELIELGKIYDIDHAECALDDSSLIKRCADSHGIIIGGFEKITKEAISAMENNARKPILIFLGIQFDTFFTPEALEYCRHKSIPIHSTGEGADSVAERTLDMILKWHPANLQMGLAIRSNNVPSIDETSKSLNVAVIGAGRIGSKVIAGLADKVGKIKYFDRKPNNDLNGYASYHNDLAMAFLNTDIATIHLSLLDKTKGIIGSNEMLMMRSGGVVINAARNKIIDFSGLKKVYEIAPDDRLNIWDTNLKELADELSPIDFFSAKEMIHSGFLRLTGHTFAVSEASKKERGIRLLELIKSNGLY